MIEIKITDPHLMDKKSLSKLAQYLLDVADCSPKLLTPVPMTPSTSIDIPNIPSMSNLDAAPVYNPPAEDKINPYIDPELDASGTKWDGDIHSRTKSKTPDGLWKPIRAAGKRPDAIEFPPSPPIAPIAPASVAIAPIAPIHATVDPIAPMQNDFPALMAMITKGVNSGKLQPPAVIKIVQSMGLQSLPVVATRPELIPDIMAQIEILIATATV